MSDLGFTLGEHQLVRKIKSGSYGEVWLARNELGTYRALKIIRAERFETLEPLVREYEGIKKFEPVSRAHDGLVDILQVGRVPGTQSFYYVMELADDVRSGQAIDPATYVPKTLSRERATGTRVSLESCTHYGIELCSALAFLHDRGLIHRDVKPSNVIFVEGRPKLADMGLIAALHSASTYVGTTGFIPPEGPNSPQADIFALGKLLYELATGNDRNAFPSLPEGTEFSENFLEFNAVLSRACQQEKEKRYASARKMAEDLELISRGNSVRRLHLLESRVKRVGRGLLAAVFLLLVIGPSYYAWNKARQDAREAKARAIGAEIQRGTELLQKGDYLGALKPFLGALRLDDAKGEAQLTDRLRIGSTLDACAQLHLLIPLSADAPLKSCDASGGLLLCNIQRQHSVLIDADSGTRIEDCIGDGTVPERSCFTPDGSRVLLSCWDDTVRLFDWRIGQYTFEGKHPKTVYSAAMSADGQKIVTGCLDNHIYIWDLSTANREILGSHSDVISSVAISPSCRRAATTSYDKTVRLWDLQNRILEHTLSHKSWVYTSAFSPDERVLATGSYDGEVRLWRVEDGSEIAPPLTHPGGVYKVDFSPTGDRLLSACLDGNVYIWDARIHKLVPENHTLRHSSRVYDAVFDGPARVIVAQVGGSLGIWDLSTVAEIPSVSKKLESKIDIQSAELIPSFNVHSDNSISLVRRTPRVVHSRSGRYCAYPQGHELFLCDLVVHTESKLTTSHDVTIIEFSNDEQHLVSASCDGNMTAMAAQIWNTADGSKKGPPLSHKDGITSVHFSPDDKVIVTTSKDFTAAIWDAATGRRLEQLLHKEKVYDAAFAHEHKWIATCSEDRSAVIWEIKTGQPVTPPLKFVSAVQRVSWGQHDADISVKTEDGVVWRWPLRIEKRSIAELTRIISSMNGTVDTE